MQVSTAVLEKGASLFEADVAALYSLGGMDGAVYAYGEGGEGFILKFVPVSLDREAFGACFFGHFMHGYE